jgi:hypothetical protein
MDSKLNDLFEDMPKEVQEALFSEANKKLSSVNLSSQALDRKSFFISTALISILGFVLSLTSSNELGKLYIAPASILLLGFCASFFLLAKAIYARKYYGDSFKPSEILSAGKQWLKTKSTFNHLLIEWYDAAIVRNCNANDKRGGYINNAIIIAFTSLSLFFSLYVLLKIAI